MYEEAIKILVEKVGGITPGDVSITVGDPFKVTSNESRAMVTIQVKGMDVFHDSVAGTGPFDNAVLGIAKSLLVAKLRYVVHHQIWEALYVTDLKETLNRLANEGYVIYSIERGPSAFTIVAHARGLEQAVLSPLCRR